jgi:hypothetical protein
MRLRRFGYGIGGLMLAIAVIIAGLMQFIRIGIPAEVIGLYLILTGILLLAGR